MKKSDSIIEISKALAAFQLAVEQPEKSAVNPHFKSNYVTLDSVVDTINKLAPKHGLTYTQMAVTDETGAGVITMIMHSSGEYIEFPPFILPVDRKSAQGVGSSITYARRYSLSAAFGIASDVDDDGNHATATQNSRNSSVNGSNSNAKPSGNGKVSDKQMKMINTKINELATLRNVDKEQVKGTLHSRFGVTSFAELTASAASEVIETLVNWIKNAQQ